MYLIIRACKQSQKTYMVFCTPRRSIMDSKNEKRVNVGLLVIFAEHSRDHPTKKGSRQLEADLRRWKGAVPMLLVCTLALFRPSRDIRMQDKAASVDDGP
jgi:hypothetical protein